MIVYDEAPYLDKLRRKGFDLTSIHHGSWSGKRHALERGDTIVLTRRA